MFVGSPTERRRFATFEFRAVWLNIRSPDSACHVMWHGGTGAFSLIYMKSINLYIQSQWEKKRKWKRKKRSVLTRIFISGGFYVEPVFLLLMYLVFNAPCISFFYGVIYNFVVQFVLYSFSVIWSLCINFPLFLAKIFTYFFLLRHPLSHFINYIDMLTV